jgi:hypothetical protein
LSQIRYTEHGTPPVDPGGVFAYIAATGLLERHMTAMLFNYRCLPWFDRGIWFTCVGEVFTLYMDDKAGSKEPWAFATFHNGVMSAVDGREQDMEWYRSRMRKWVSANPGKNLYGDPFFNIWEWHEEPAPESRPSYTPFPLLVD